MFIHFVWLKSVTRRKLLCYAKCFSKFWMLFTLLESTIQKELFYGFGEGKMLTKGKHFGLWKMLHFVTSFWVTQHFSICTVQNVKFRLAFCKAQHENFWNKQNLNTCSAFCHTQTLNYWSGKESSLPPHWCHSHSHFVRAKRKTNVY